MTMPRCHFLTTLVPLVALAAGCAASGGSEPIYGSGGGGSMGTGGDGGSTSSRADAAAFVGDADASSKPDASRAEAVHPNLSADAPTYKWDACVGCTGGSTGGLGGSTGASGAGGLSGSGGKTSGAGGSAAGGATGKGGSPGSGGALSSGGTTGSGGASGTGGSSADAGPSDAPPMLTDAAAPDVGGLTRDAGPDASYSADALVADSLPTDTLSRCVAQIESVVPATDSFEDFSLVAGPNLRVVLRAVVVSGGPAIATGWSWQANRDGTPIPSTLGAQDPASATFLLTDGGNYFFTATDQTGTCSVTVQNAVAPATTCPDCSRNWNLRFAPAPNTNIPVQSGYFRLIGTAPFAQDALVLSSGVPVQVSPSVGSARVASYIRINDSGGDLVADGLSDPQAGGFATQLLDVNYSGALLKYDVLVVPIDGSAGGTVGATAPQLFQTLSPANINSATFSLSGGVTVTGSTLDSSGQPVADVRVMLTNQDPAAAPQPSKLVFSSVGRSDAQGRFSLHAQPGSYWVSISPPLESGLPEAVTPAAVTVPLSGNATIDFKWDPVSAASFVLNVYDALGNPSVGTRVRLTSAQANKVGTLTASSAPSGAQAANGNVQIEDTTSATGSVTFANLPDGATYNVLLVPPALGPSSATTSLSLALPTGGATQSVLLAAQGRVRGQLTSASGQIDWTHVEVVAYDRSSDTPEVPVAVAASLDGTFSVGVSPGRAYVLLVVPEVSTGLARTFVGPGPMQASEFAFIQEVPAAMPWSSIVMDGLQNGLAGTAMQVFCIEGWPYCVDPTLPLAETTSGDGGVFQFALPDSSTR